MRGQSRKAARAVLAVVVAVAVPQSAWWDTNHTVFAQAVVSGLLIGGVYSLVAMGLSLVFGVLDIINFAHGALMTFAWFVISLIAASVAGGVVGELLFFIGYFVLLTVVGLAVPAILAEGKNAWTGLRRSVQLTSGHLFQILVILLVSQVAGMIIATIVSTSLIGLHFILGFVGYYLALSVFKALEVSALTVAFWKIRKLPQYES